MTYVVTSAEVKFKTLMYAFLVRPCCLLKKVFFLNLLFRKLFLEWEYLCSAISLQVFLQSRRGRRQASCILHMHNRLKGRCREHTIAFYLKNSNNNNDDLASLKVCVHPPLILYLVVDAMVEWTGAKKLFGGFAIKLRTHMTEYVFYGADFFSKLYDL